MGQTTLETERLTLVPLRAEHTDAVVEVFADKSMSTYLDLDISAPDNAREMMRQRLAFDGPPGMGHWAFLQGGTVVGIGHLRPSWELPGELPEIGWYLSPTYGGRGLATEAAAALLHHGLADLALNSVWALVHVDNKPSLQLAARLGFLTVGTGVHYGAEHRVHVALPR
ncbi:GNAT family N-acetyltransferase [Nocardia sp. XZ_19_369]|uniref:GNAT family N-acetyltransferase n=1 Tax=Nocardia sp. XZ_19_369 TaxID=2769487 RepID=UPI00188FFC76|nr:GNAT family N-acetyltransferase [Nocardia sp. XZ_19_369]